MDFTLRCNSLKCRAQLTDHAVVTTCSHVFCVNCSEASGLSNASGNGRTCPACQTRLANVDDAVTTTLNPSEDYKTSVLSGLSPSIIMECAGRGLAFYSYQTSQEIVYQGHVAKGLAAKHSTLSAQLDQIIHEANAEISNLRNKVSALNSDQEVVRRKNNSLREAYGEKVRQYQKCQANYDKMRKKVLDSDVQLAAENAVEETLHRDNDKRIGGPPQRYSVDYNGIEQIHRRQKSGSSGTDENLFHPNQPSHIGGYGQSWQQQPQPLATPSIHRTRLPMPTPEASWMARSSESRRPPAPSLNTLHPLASLEPNSMRPVGQHGLTYGATYLGRK